MNVMSAICVIASYYILLHNSLNFSLIFKSYSVQECVGVLLMACIEAILTSNFNKMALNAICI